MSWREQTSREATELNARFSLYLKGRTYRSNNPRTSIEDHVNSFNVFVSHDYLDCLPVFSDELSIKTRGTNGRFEIDAWLLIPPLMYHRMHYVFYFQPK